MSSNYFLCAGHIAHEQPPSPSLSTRVCLALAAADDVHPWESSPLYDAIDHGVLEALEALETRDSREWQFEFEVGLHTVEVTNDGTVTVDDVGFSESDVQAALDSLDDRGNFDRPVDSS